MFMAGGGGLGPAKFRPSSSPAVRGKGRKSMRALRATHQCSWAGLRRPEMGGRREAEPAAGGSCGGGAPASGKRRGRVGEVRWSTGELRVLSIWGGSERRVELHGDRAHGGINGGGGSVHARGGSVAAFYRQMGREEGHGRAGPHPGVATGKMDREMRRRHRDAGERR
jgi:hypothetical protein